MVSNPKTLCDQCTALCCMYITIEIDKPRSKRQHDDIRWYLLHKGITLLIEDGRWMIKVPTPCEKVDKKGRCTIYETRPETCRDYSTDNCDYHTEHEEWETDYVEIETPEAYEQYRESRRRKKTTTDPANSEKSKLKGKSKAKSKKP